MISCFETIEMVDGRFFALEHHLERLRTTASRLGLPPVDDEAVLGALASTRAMHGGESSPPGRDRSRHQVRVGWGTHAHPIVATRPLVLRDRTVALRVDHSSPHDTDSPLSGLKSNSYADAVARAVAHPDTDEVVVLDRDRHVIGCLYANLFVVHGATDGPSPLITTPPLDEGCRDGVTRSLVIKGLSKAGVRVCEGPVPLLDLMSADAAFITSTGHGVRAVSSIGDQTFDSDSPAIRSAEHVLGSWHGDPAMWA